VKNNVEKGLPSFGDLKEKDKLIKLAAETAAEELGMQEFMDMKYEEQLRLFLKNNPDKTEDDFKAEIIRLSLSSGGKVISFSDYAKSKDPKIKKINLADYFEFGRTVASLSDDEKEVVNKLLKMSLGKDK
jgi:hypothetical protein